MIKSFIAKKVLGFALGSWLKGVLVAILIAAFSFLVIEYNKGQKAIGRIKDLEAVIETERQAFTQELAASEKENALQRIRHADALADVDREIVAERERSQNVREALSRIDSISEEENRPAGSALLEALRSIK